MKALASLAVLFLALLASQAYAVVNLNTATQSQLESVKGIGPSKAKAIIEYRSKNGNFNSVDELDKIKCFGKASIGKLKPELTVADEKPAKEAKPAN